MIWKIAKKEFLLNLMMFKFAVGTIVCVVLTSIFTPILVDDYQQRLKEYNTNVTTDNAKLKNVKVYRTITPTVFKPPSILSVFSEGLEKRLTNSSKIELETIPEINPGLADDNPFLTIFPSLDISLIFKTVISILALLIAYDVISGEREWGTLKLILSGRVARHQVLIGKIFAGLITLVVPITVSFVAGLLILEWSPMVDLSGSDWARVGLIYLTSLIFTSVMYHIGLLFSCLARKSATSLMLGLFCWVIFTTVIPNGAVRLATHIRPLEPKEKMNRQIEALTKDMKDDDKHLWSQLDGLSRGMISSAHGAFGEKNYVRAISKSEVEYRVKRYSLQDSLQKKYADKYWEVKHRYINDLFKQKHLADNFSRISPVFLYENAISALAGSDSTRSQYFIDRARIYRNNIIEYMHSKTDNFSSPSYFTPCSEEDMEECEKLYSHFQNARKSGDKVARKTAYDAFQKGLSRISASQRPLDLRDIPKFIYQPALTGNLKNVIFDLGLLVFMNILLFTLSFIAFLRYDVRLD